MFLERSRSPGIRGRLQLVLRASSGPHQERAGWSKQQDQHAFSARCILPGRRVTSYDSPFVNFILMFIVRFFVTEA